MLVEQLKALGVEPGAVLLVHCAFSRVAPLEGGLPALIAALRAAIGPAGTLVMPSMCDDDEVPFDRTASPCRALGIDNPHAFAAVGPRRPSPISWRTRRSSSTPAGSPCDECHEARKSMNSGSER